MWLVIRYNKIYISSSQYLLTVLMRLLDHNHGNRCSSTERLCPEYVTKMSIHVGILVAVLNELEGTLTNHGWTNYRQTALYTT